MITSNKNEKITELTYNLTSLINKIENNIEIIDNDNFNNLLIKSKDLISKNESSYLYIIFSKGIFDVVSSIEQLYTNVYYQDYILINSLSCKSYFQNDFEPVYLEIEIRLKYLFFTQSGQKQIMDVCNESLSAVISLYSIYSLRSLAYNRIPYSLANNEQKLFRLFCKYTYNELADYIVGYFLENHDKSLKIDEFKNDILYQVSLNDIYYESVFEVDELFLEIEKEHLASYIYSFCNMFSDYRRKYLM